MSTNTIYMFIECVYTICIKVILHMIIRMNKCKSKRVVTKRLPLKELNISTSDQHMNAYRMILCHIVSYLIIFLSGIRFY